VFTIAYALAVRQLEHRRRRLAKYTRYRRSEKGRARQARYDASPKGIARHLLYEKTVRAVMRAPRPSFMDVPLGPNPFGNAFGSESGRERNSATFASPQPEYNWMVGRNVPRRFAPHPFTIRAQYADQIRKERREGLLTPMTFAQLSEQQNPRRSSSCTR
jgi:hypothetical protein